MSLDKFSNRKGVTLIELLVTLAVVGIVLNMIFSFFLQGTRTHSFGEMKSDAQQDTTLAAFSITNMLRNVDEISLSNVSGYSSLNIQSRFPNIETVEYVIKQQNGAYSLHFTLVHNEGYTLESEVLLNNVRDAELGSVNNDVWFLDDRSDGESPYISIGIISGTIVAGTGGSVTFPVTTANIEDGESLHVRLNGSPSGLSISSSNVSNNSAEITINATSAVSSGIYNFTVDYLGASESTGTLLVGENLPVITLKGNSTISINQGDPFNEPGYNAIDGTYGDITSRVVVGGDTVNSNIPGTYEVTYNVTNIAGIPANEKVRTVIVEKATDLSSEIASIEYVSNNGNSITFRVRDKNGNPYNNSKWDNITYSQGLSLKDPANYNGNLKHSVITWQWSMVSAERHLTVTFSNLEIYSNNEKDHNKNNINFEVRDNKGSASTNLNLQISVSGGGGGWEWRPATIK